MSNLKKVIFVTISQLTTVLVNFILISILSRKLSLLDNATVFQSLLYTDFSYVIFQLGVANSLYVLLAQTEKVKLKKLNFNIFVFVCISSVLCISLVHIISSPLSDYLKNPELVKGLRLYKFIYPITLMTNLLSLVNIYYGKVRESSLISLITSVAKFALIYFASNMYNLNYNIVLLLYLLSAIISVLAHLYISLKNGFIQMEYTFDREILKRILWISAPLGLTGILGFSYALVSGTMVSKMMGNIDYAYFSNGARELPFIGALVSSITTVYMPTISKLMAEHKYVDVLQLKLRLNTMVAAAVYPIITLLIFWAKDLIILLMSHKYTNSISVFIFFTAILYIRITDYQDVLIGAKRGDKILLANIAFVILNLSLVFIGIKVYGITGAAIGVFMSVFLLAAILIKFTSNYCKSSIKEIIDYKKIFYILSLSLIMAIPLYFIHNIIFKISYTIIYTVSVYLLIDYFRLANIKELIFKVIKR